MQRIARTFAIAGLLIASVAAPAIAQDNNNNNNNNNNQQLAGVEVDASGVLRFKQVDAAAAMARAKAARGKLSPEMAKVSPLRKVSLNRLEKLATAELKANGKLSPDMLNMAGLTAVKYVFFYPESGDIVLAGPAEGYAEDGLGNVVGVESGRPTILLEDVIVALRAFPPTGEKTKVIGVSIDPTKEGLERMQTYLRSLNGRSIGPADAFAVATGLKQSLGLQTVSVKGIPAKTHFARVLVEADYRMKLIGIGLERPAVPIKSFAERSAGKSNSALQRWYFVPDYAAVRISEDQLALMLDGPGVKLVGAEELVRADGTRADKAGKINKASQQFTQEFTEKYAALADRTPVYAQMRNLIDLSIAAAFIQEGDFYAQSGWDLGAFAKEQSFAVERHAAPEQVESAVNAYFRNGVLTTPVGGGVNIQARQAISAETSKDTTGKVGTERAAVKIEGLADNQWWWD